VVDVLWFNRLKRYAGLVAGSPRRHRDLKHSARLIWVAPDQVWGHKPRHDAKKRFNLQRIAPMKPISAGWAWFRSVLAVARSASAFWLVRRGMRGLAAPARSSARLAAFLVALLLPGFAGADLAKPPVVPGGERLLEPSLDVSRSLGNVFTLSWSPDGRRLATGSSDNTARIWDGQTGAEIAVLKGHSGSVRSVAWSPDGRRLATGSNDNTARIWDGQTGAEIAVLKGHSGSIRSVAWSPDSRRLVTGSDDNTARIWGVETGKSALFLVGGDDGRWLGCREDEGTCLRFDDGTLVRRLDGAFVRPLLPPATATLPAFEAVETLDRISVADGEQRRISLKVRNNGGDAFGVRLRLNSTATSPDQTATSLPAIYAVGSDAVPEIPAGEVATLALTVVGAAREPNPVPETMELPLAIEHAHGVQELGAVKADLRAPGLPLRRRSFGVEISAVNRRYKCMSPITEACQRPA
jgi:hypothetical protein